MTTLLAADALIRTSSEVVLFWVFGVVAVIGALGMVVASALYASPHNPREIMNTTKFVPLLSRPLLHAAGCLSAPRRLPRVADDGASARRRAAAVFTAAS